MYLVFNKDTRDLISCNNDSHELTPHQVYAGFNDATMFIVNYSGTALPDDWSLSEDNEIVVPPSGSPVPDETVEPIVLTELQLNIEKVYWTLIKEKANDMSLSDVVDYANEKLGE